MQNDHLDEHIKILSQKKPNIDLSEFNPNRYMR